MSNKKFLSDEQVSFLWDKTKEYIGKNAATSNSNVSFELDERIFGKPPYVLKFISEDNNNDDENLPSIKEKLEDYTWEEISEISKSGLAQNYFSIGDTKTITLNGQVGEYINYENIELEVFILGINHNSEIEGTGITFAFCKKENLDCCLTDSMFGTDIAATTGFNLQHNTAKNFGGWSACDMRYNILGSTNTEPDCYGEAKVAGATGYDASSTCATNPVPNTLMAALPADLRAVMKPITKYSNNVGGTASTLSETIDYLPLLSVYEIMGETSYESEKQAQYQYYINGNTKSKYSLNTTTQKADYWTRTPNVGQQYFCVISIQGELNYRNCMYSRGVAPIFLV